MLTIKSQWLALQDIILDGGAGESLTGSEAQNELVRAEKGILELYDGAIIQNNNNVSGFSPSPGGIQINHEALVYMYPGSHIRNCRGGDGGGVAVVGNPNSAPNHPHLLMYGGIIEDCQAIQGGGVFIKSRGLMLSQALRYSDGTLAPVFQIRGCTASGHGGGIYVDSGILQLPWGTIQGNSAEYGGGMYFEAGQLQVGNLTVTENVAKVYAGGIFSSPQAAIGFGDPNVICSPRVTGNKCGEGYFDDVYLDGSAGDTPTSDDEIATQPMALINALKDNASIGISRWVRPDENQSYRVVVIPGKVTGGERHTITKSDLAKFPSDDPDYVTMIYSNPDDSNDPENGTIVITSAKVVFNNQGHGPTVPDHRLESTGPTARVVSEPDPGLMVAEGYTFGGWYREPTCENAWNFESEVTDFNKNKPQLTLYAKWTPITYHIAYKLAGGQLAAGKTNPATYNVNSEAITLNNPEREGYTFLGWTWTGQDTPQKDAAIPTGSTGDREFTAHWGASVTYKDGVNGTVFTDKKHENLPEGAETPKFNATPERAGYIFNDWSPKVADKVAGNAVYTAQWKPEQYTIKYELHEGKLADGKTNPDTYTIESKPITLNNPAKEGYTFLGWVWEGQDTPQESAGVPAGSTGNRSFTACWKEIPKYAVTYKDGVNGTVFTDERHENLPEGAETPKFNGTPERAGYIFNDWSPEVADKVTGNAVYTAQWELEQYTIKYELHEGKLADGKTNPATYNVNSEAIALNNPAKEGYTFLGWVWEGQDTPQESAGVPAGSTGDRSFTACWEEIPKYAVTYKDGVNGTVFTDKKYENLLEGAETPKFNATPERAGYIFNGWSPEIADKVAGNAVYTAQWKPEQYTIKYELHGGKLADGEENPASYTIESAGITLNNPTREGYTFLGWVWEGQDTPQESAGIPAGSTGDRSFTACWKEIPKYTVIYQDSPDDKTFEDQKIENLPEGSDTPEFAGTPEREGYTFQGWTPDVTEEVTEDTVYTAKWELVTYHITYELGEGTLADGAVNPDSYTIESDPIILRNPTKKGYIFLGWVWKGHLSPQESAGIPAGSTGDRSFTARWEKIPKYTVTYTDGADGKAFEDQKIENLPEGSDTPEFAGAPERESYTFQGWLPEVADHVTGDAVYTAQWKKNESVGPPVPSGPVLAPDNPSPEPEPGPKPESGSGPKPESKPDGEQLPYIPPALESREHFAYIVGFPDGTVRPEAYITRSEAVSIFYRLMTDAFRAENWADSNPFPDVSSSDWYNNAVSTTFRAGLVRGLPDGSFGGNNNISRAELATIAARFLSDENAPDSGLNDLTGHWAKRDVDRAVAAGWIKGFPDGGFHPDDYISRAEVMTLVNRMLGRMPRPDGMLENMTRWTDNPPSAWYYAGVQEATNSHHYVRNGAGITETWTGLTENRDWTKLER